MLFGEQMLDPAPQRVGAGGLHPPRRHGVGPLIQPGLRADAGHPEQHVGFLAQPASRLVDHVLPRLGQPAQRVQTPLNRMRRVTRLLLTRVGDTELGRAGQAIEELTG